MNEQDLREKVLKRLGKALDSGDIDMIKAAAYVLKHLPEQTPSAPQHYPVWCMDYE